MKPWAASWTAAADEFWAREWPTEHFRTSVSEPIAERMVAEAVRLDERFGHPAEFTILDVGAGDGDLLDRILAGLPNSLRSRVRPIGLDLRQVSRPGVEWLVARAPGPPPIEGVVGLVMAHEWLDEIPCDVVEQDAAGVNRLVLVDVDGTEALGPPLADAAACAAYGVDAVAAATWIATYWPLNEPGERAEVGIGRDRAWEWLTKRVKQGTVIATDYMHPATGPRPSLVGYRSGQLVPPVPDGSVNLTAHVLVESCAARVPGSTINTQREMLSPVATPLTTTDGVTKARNLARSATLARLRDPRGAGAFGWLRWESNR